MRENKYAPNEMVLQRPLEGLELTFRVGSLGELEDLLRSQLAKRALVCLSPNRTERCDAPATRIAWQDAGEWYPCCDEHWTGGSRWPDDPRFYEYTTQLIVFAERESDSDLRTAVSHEFHNRAGTATCASRECAERSDSRVIAFAPVLTHAGRLFRPRAAD